METRSARILRILNIPKYETTKGLDEYHRKRLIDEMNLNKLIIKENNTGGLISSTVTTNNEIVTTTTRSNSPEIPPALPIVISQGGISVNFEAESKSNEKIKILSQTIVNNDSQLRTISNIDKPNLDHCSKENVENILSDISNALTSTNKFNISQPKALHNESWSEDKTSGSEYVPTDDSIVSNTSDDEVTRIARKNKLKKYGLIKELDIIKNSRLKNITFSSDEEPTCSTKENKREKYRNINRKKYREREPVIKNRLDEIPDSTTPESTNISSMSATLSELLPKISKDNIEITAATKSNGKLIRNKVHACYFCHKIVQNSARHFAIMHGREIEVAKLLAMPKHSKQRRNGFTNLLRVGDFYHNSDVISTKRGELILARRPTQEESKFVTLYDYGPCPHCLGFMLKRHIWHHIKINCTSATRGDLDKNRHVIAESNAILYNTFGAELSSDFVTYISSKMRDDDIGNYCKDDPLIIKFGAMQFEKYGTTQCELIRQSMRQLARFTLKLREIENSNKTLSDYLVPQKFDLIIQATKSLCVSHQNTVKRPEFDVPSLALKIGYSLKKCAAIKRGSCLRSGNLSGNETLICFLNLIELEWSTRISSNALATMYNRKINATQLLPLTSDLIKLNQYIDSEMTKARESLSEGSSLQKWSFLACLSLTKVILFNKRRSGEASRMTIIDYSSRPKWSEQCTDELKKSLTDFERRLADKLTVIEIVGKRGRKVPVLLTRDVKLSIDILIRTRDDANISKENPYVFARAGNSTMNMRGHDCLRKTCSDACLEHPQNITSTKLRKYIATVCQVFNLSDNDYDWLARHLGHDIRVHREFYRLHESAVELTKVSRLLIAVDRGEVNKYAGKKLEEINLEDIQDIEESEDEEEIVEDMTKIEVGTENLYQIQVNSKKRQNPFAQSPSSTPVQAINETQEKRRKTSRRRAWSPEEKEAVLQFFKSAIKRDVVPGKAECSKCIAENSVLSSRTWTDIKFCVKNHLTKIRKMKK